MRERQKDDCSYEKGLCMGEGVSFIMHGLGRSLDDRVSGIEKLH